MKTNMLKSKRVLANYDKKTLADILGICKYSYTKKEDGKSDFTSKQISILMNVLRLTPEEVVEIFLH